MWDGEHTFKEDNKRQKASKKTKYRTAVIRLAIGRGGRSEVFKVKVFSVIKESWCLR
jgi:hypothetical protein